MRAPLNNDGSYTGSRATSALAPLLTGYFIQYVSIALPFYIAASFQLASASLMYILFKDIRPPEEEKA